VQKLLAMHFIGGLSNPLDKWFCCLLPGLYACNFESLCDAGESDDLCQRCCWATVPNAELTLSLGAKKVPTVEFGTFLGVILIAASILLNVGAFVSSRPNADALAIDCCAPTTCHEAT